MPETPYTSSKIPPTNDKFLMGALSYVWIVSILMLLIKRNDDFIGWHARQATVLFVGSLLGFIPVIGWLIAFLSILGMLVGFVTAWQGKKFALPFVHDLAEKIKF